MSRLERWLWQPAADVVVAVWWRILESVDQVVCRFANSTDTPLHLTAGGVNATPTGAGTSAGDGTKDTTTAAAPTTAAGVPAPPASTTPDGA